MYVINLFGASGSGKSTTAKLLSGMLSINGYSTELVEEYAKELVHAQHTNLFEQQELILAEQNKKQKILSNHGYDFIITDSPLLLINIYKKEYKYIEEYPEEFENFVKWRFLTYKNINIFLNRKIPYSQKGRLQTQEEANIIEEKMKKYLKENNIEFIEIDNEFGLKTINKILNLLYNKKYISKQIEIKEIND